MGRRGRTGGAKAGVKATSGANLGFEAKLWLAADKLRGEARPMARSGAI